MSRIVLERVDRFSKRLENLEHYLREEAEDDYLADQIQKYNSLAADAVFQTEFPETHDDYINSLKYCLLYLSKIRLWLTMANDKGYLEYQTYISLRRECDELFKIFMRKTKKLFEDLLGDIDL